MNRLIATTICAAIVSLVHVSAFGQAPVAGPQGQVAPVQGVQPQVRAASAVSHVAVIDVGYIFKNHLRFKAAMER